MHMTIGPNLGNVLLDIAQTAIQDGDTERAVTTYTQSLNGFTEDYAIAVLKNQYVLITGEDKVTVNLTDDEDLVEKNKSNIIDWNNWINRKVQSLKDCIKSLVSIENEFNRHVNDYILDCDIAQVVKDYFGEELGQNVGVSNIAAKLIAGKEFSDLYSNGENIWETLCFNVQNECAEKYEYALYFIVEYVNLIRCLHKDYMLFSKSYDFLIRHEMIERPLKVEMVLEGVIYHLKNFSNTSYGYYHPICNTELYNYKVCLMDDLLSTAFGKEYFENGAIEKNIIDGYDAGWLSPEGKFYGGDGTASSMIHLNIAENLTGDVDGDIKFEKSGWMKIHHDEVYGYFIGDPEPIEDFPYAYCPTDKQIELVCDYIDRYHNHKLYTHPKIVRSTQPITTYKLRQMDKIKLHEIFGL